MVNKTDLNNTCRWIVDQEKNLHGYKLHKPASADNPWNMAMLILMIPPEKQDEFIQETVDIVETYLKPYLEVV